jgi:hypothetical protein
LQSSTNNLFTPLVFKKEIWVGLRRVEFAPALLFFDLPRSRGDVGEFQMVLRFAHKRFSTDGPNERNTT